MHGLIARQTAPISNANLELPDRGPAEPRKTSTPAQQPRTPLGHLGKLPVEIRLMIYRHVFQGSKVTFFTFSKEGLASYPHDSVRSGFRRLRKTPRARRTNHHKLLKVSSAFYKEAVCQYWHETVVTGRAFNQWRECCSLDMLARGLSQLVKNNIRHLRRIYINTIQLRSKDILAERNTALLADFKKLETLEFSSWELAATQQSLSPVAEGPAASVASEKVFMFKVGRGCDPRVALVNCYGLDVHEPALGRIHFLTKQLCPYYQFPLASRQGHCPRRSAELFLDFTHGIFYAVRTRGSAEFAGEAAFERVVEASKTAFKASPEVENTDALSRHHHKDFAWEPAIILHKSTPEPGFEWILS